MSARVWSLLAPCALLLASCRTAVVDAAAPPQARTAAWREDRSADGTWRVLWRCEPDPLPFLEPGRLLVEARRADGTPAEELRVDAGMPQHGHGVPRRMHVEPLGEGRFAVEDVYLTMPGTWRIYLDLGREGVFERLELELEVD